MLNLLHSVATAVFVNNKASCALEVNLNIFTHLNHLKVGQSHNISRLLRGQNSKIKGRTESETQRSFHYIRRDKKKRELGYLWLSAICLAWLERLAGIERSLSGSVAGSESAPWRYPGVPASPGQWLAARGPGLHRCTACQEEARE